MPGATAAVPVLDPWTSTYTPSGGDAVPLGEFTRADLPASLGTKS